MTASWHTMSSTGGLKQEPFRLEHSKALFFLNLTIKTQNKALRSSIYATIFRQALKPRITYSHCYLLAFTLSNFQTESFFSFGNPTNFFIKIYSFLIKIRGLPLYDFTIFNFSIFLNLFHKTSTYTLSSRICFKE